MLKVYLEGFEQPYAVVGEFLREDERYLVILDGDIKKKIPHRRIVYLEDLSQALPAVSTEAPLRNESPKELTKEQVAKAIRDSITKPEPVSVEPKVKTWITLFFQGAAKDVVRVEVPEDLILGNHYSPALSKEIALNPQVRAIMDRGIIFDGLPTISGTNVYVRCKEMKSTVESATEALGKTGLFSKVFQRPAGSYPTSFAITNAGGRAGEVFDSPFDGPVKLTEEEPIDDSHPEQTTGTETEDSAELSGL